LLLCVFLFVWEPLKLAGEISGASGTLSMRGPAAVVELFSHAAVAALTVGATWALWIGNPRAPAFAAVAVASSAAATLQSFYWSVLPHDILPAERLSLAAAAIAHAAAWIVYLRKSRRVHAAYD
jgi:hypothetical protein